MRSGRSLLLLPLWGVLALWSPLLPASNDYVTRCATFPNKSKRCSLPQEVFFYNINSKKCERFTDYACPKILNRYFSLEECQYYCAHDDYCQLPPDHGPCYLRKPRWFYDPNTQSCKSFTFGGCMGNVNNFKNEIRAVGVAPKEAFPKGSMEGSSACFVLKKEGWIRTRPGAGSLQAPLEGREFWNK